MMQLPESRVVDVGVSTHLLQCMAQCRKTLRIMTAFDYPVEWAAIDEETQTVSFRCKCYDAAGDASIEWQGQMRVTDGKSTLEYWQTEPFSIDVVRDMTPEETAQYMRERGFKPRYRGLELNGKYTIRDQEYVDFAVLGRLCLDLLNDNTDVADRWHVSAEVQWDLPIDFELGLSASLIRQRALLRDIARHCANGGDAKTLQLGAIFGWLNALSNIAHAMEAS